MNNLRSKKDTKVLVVIDMEDGFENMPIPGDITKMVSRKRTEFIIDKLHTLCRKLGVSVTEKTFQSHVTSGGVLKYSYRSIPLLLVHPEEISMEDDSLRISIKYEVFGV